MNLIEIKTLVDITNTDVRRINQGTQQELDQFRNWVTLLQCTGMRSIINYDNNPTSEVVDIKNLKFGSEYKGQHKVWTFLFRPDRSDAYMMDNNVVGSLLVDFNNVPIIVNLTETINISKPLFLLNDPKFTNLVISVL